MRLINSALFILAAIILFASCQKEVDGTIDERPTGNDSILLEHFVELDTTLPTGLDTVWQMRYTYDAQKRVKQSISTYYLFGPQSDVTEYFYSGNDTLPYKIVVTWPDAVNTYRDTTFFTYVNGQVLIDSTIEWKINTNEFWNTSTTIYTPNGNNIDLSYRDYYNPGQTPPDFVSTPYTVQRTLQNGNIITQDAPFNGSTNRKHHLASYDNNINPFHKTEIPYPVLNSVNTQKNNPLEHKLWDDPAMIDGHNQYTYTYRADGRPLIVRSKDLQNQAVYKGLYFYTK